MPPHGLIFTVAPQPFAILVALVRRNRDDCLDRPDMASRLEHMHRPHDICRVGLQGLRIRLTHQGLRRHMKDNLGAECVHLRPQGLRVTDVNDMVLHALSNPRDRKQGGVRWRLQGNAANLCAHGLQPQAEPATFKAGVPRDQDPPALPKIPVG